jgi:hypothetical protein
MDPSPAGLVLSALKDSNIPAKRNEVQSAFHGPDRDANAKWVSEHLRDHTLLSKDELTLYAILLILEVRNTDTDSIDTPTW